MKLIKPLIAALFVVQLAVPAYMIYEQNQILSDGVEYKFKTVPIDPYDPFRGRYVTLRYDVTADPIAADDYLQKGDWIYAVIDTNDKGFATFTKLMSNKPEAPQDYMKLQVSWGSPNSGYYVKVPFTRYYAQEDVAPKIEQVVWRRQEQEIDDVYVAINVLNGKAALKELYIDGLPVRDFLDKKLQKQQNEP
jgi:uncharacterized membrane-anchored protein